MSVVNVPNNEVTKNAGKKSNYVSIGTAYELFLGTWQQQSPFVVAICENNKLYL